MHVIFLKVQQSANLQTINTKIRTQNVNDFSHKNRKQESEIYHANKKKSAIKKYIARDLALCAIFQF